MNKALSLAPGRKRAYLTRGIAKYQLNDMVGAEADLNQFLAAFPREAEGYLYRAESRFSQQRFKEGLADLETGIELDSTDVRLFTSLAIANMRLDRNDAVISVCDRAVRSHPKSMMLHILRGEAKSNMGLYRIAIDDFEKAFELDSSNSRPLIDKAMALSELEQYQDAIDLLDSILEKNDENALAIFQKGRIFMKQEQPEPALFNMNRVIELRPDNSMAYFNRAIILSDQKKWNAALEDYTKVIQLNPKNILGHFNRGLIHIQLKDPRSAKADLERTIELYPDFLDANEVLSQVYKDLGNSAGYDAQLLEMEAINSRNFQKNDALKYQQKMQLLRLTNFRGEFEDSPLNKAVPSVELDLAASFKCTLFPELNEGFVAYDGWKQQAMFKQIITAIGSEYEVDDSTRNATITKLEAEERSAVQLWELAVHLASKQHFNRAETLLRESIGMDSLQVMAYFTLARIQHHLLEEEEEKITARYFGDEPTPSYKAHLEKADSVYAEVEHNYRKALVAVPDFQLAAFNLGNVLAEQRKFEEAVQMYTRAIESDPDLTQAYYNRGQILLILDRTEESCKDLSVAGQLGSAEAYGLIRQYCD